MYVLSTIHWQKLLRRNDKKGKFIDVGAGDGGPTAAASHLFEEVIATEASRPLALRC
jgi:protein-L-isoaspartate O-methyltransferase